MKRFVLTWGQGSVRRIKTVYKRMTVEEKSIDDINPLIILPSGIKTKVYYVRTIFTSEAKRNYDYGSWSDFIEAEEIKEKKD